MHIYFDNSATTMTDEKVIEAMKIFNEKFYANPSSIHKYGYLVEEEIKNATKEFASFLGATDKEIIWTSGGTESNNLAISGFIDAHKRLGKKIITTKIEHPSVSKVVEKFSKEGYDVTYLSVDSTGHIDLNELKNSVNNDTILVSIMYVNNEIGSVQDIENIGRIIKERNKNTAFHVDFVQGFGKYKVDCKKMGIDMLSISGHKFNGPKGIGALYKNKSVRIIPQILGGGQQDGFRSGTLNTLGIIGINVAASLFYSNFDENIDKLLRIRDFLVNELVKLSKKYDNIYINTKNDDSFAPNIISVAFKGIRSEVMVHALEEKNIYVSSGSACSSHSKVRSATLSAIGLDSSIIDSTIRISLGKYNTLSEAATFIEAIDELIPKFTLKR